jgi:hypothetical protein
VTSASQTPRSYQAELYPVKHPHIMPLARHMLLGAADASRLVTKRGGQPFTARDRGEMRIRTSLRPGLANSSQSHQEGSEVQVRLSQAI